MKKTSNERFTEIISNFSYLSSEQAKAILELRLQRLTGLEREKVEKDLLEESKKISEYLLILASKTKIKKVIKFELEEIRDKATQFFYFSRFYSFSLALLIQLIT